jgi:hypothetical protein
MPVPAAARKSSYGTAREWRQRQGRKKAVALFGSGGRGVVFFFIRKRKKRVWKSGGPFLPQSTGDLIPFSNKKVDQDA